MVWGLLDEPDRVVVRRLAVFHGGFRRDAAVAVAGATLPALARLVDAALLGGAPNGRYTLHPRVVGFLRERLEQDPDERAATQERLRGYLGSLHGHRAGTEGPTSAGGG